MRPRGRLSHERRFRNGCGRLLASSGKHQWPFNYFLERLHQLRGVGSVDGAVIEAAGRRHDRGDLHFVSHNDGPPMKRTQVLDLEWAAVSFTIFSRHIAKG